MSNGIQHPHSIVHRHLKNKEQNKLLALHAAQLYFTRFCAQHDLDQLRQRSKGNKMKRNNSQNYEKFYYFFLEFLCQSPTLRWVDVHFRCMKQGVAKPVSGEFLNINCGNNRNFN